MAERTPHGEVLHYPAGHFDVDIEPLRSQAVADQIAFLRRYLRGPVYDPSPS